MRESAYQGKLKNKLRDMFPGCIITKQDSADIQGIPDLAIFWNDKWAMLEVKADKNSPEQPNQDYYIQRAGKMSFAAVIYPQNEQEVLNELQRSFSAGRKARTA